MRKDAVLAGTKLRRSIPLSLLLNLGVKLLLVSLALLPLVVPALPQFHSRWVPVRAVLYPLFVLTVPGLWWIRRRPRPYPHFFDTFLMVPFLLDIVGNLLGFYHLPAADVWAHGIAWALLVSALGMVLAPLPLTRLNVAALAVGFGAITHTLWEAGEYVLALLGAWGLYMTYSNTMQDTAASLLGTLLGTLLTVTLLRGKRFLPPGLLEKLPNPRNPL